MPTRSSRTVYRTVCDDAEGDWQSRRHRTKATAEIFCTPLRHAGERCHVYRCRDEWNGHQWLTVSWTLLSR
jgi:hypothetical protein